MPPNPSRKVAPSVRGARRWRDAFFLPATPLKTKTSFSPKNNLTLGLSQSSRQTQWMWCLQFRWDFMNLRTLEVYQRSQHTLNKTFVRTEKPFMSSKSLVIQKKNTKWRKAYEWDACKIKFVCNSCTAEKGLQHDICMVELCPSSNLKILKKHNDSDSKHGCGVCRKDFATKVL
jgi:hypothetical protein